MRHLIAISDDKLFAEGGGMLIRDAAGEVIGASASPATPRSTTRSWRSTASVRRG